MIWTTGVICSSTNAHFALLARCNSISRTTPFRCTSSNTRRARVTVAAVSALSSGSRRFAIWVALGMAHQAEPRAGGATVGWCPLRYSSGSSLLPPPGAPAEARRDHRHIVVRVSMDNLQDMRAKRDNASG